MIDFAIPTSVDEAVGLLARANGAGRVLAGGTDLIVQLRAGRMQPAVIVDIKRIPDLKAVRSEAGGLRVGAAVAGAELADHPEVRKHWPGVFEAARLIGSTQVQGRASLGGNLCNASPAADSVPALIAVGATCTVAGPNGRREVAVEDVVTAPGKTALGAGEFIVDFLLPAVPARASDAYQRFIPRTEMDIAVVGAAVSLALGADGTIAAARVALGAVAPTARLVPAAAATLIGTKLDDGALAQLAAAASAACQPIDDKRGTIAFRTRVAGVLARRVAVQAYDRARSRA